MAYLTGWFAILASFLVIDAIWLGFVARDFYRRNLGYLMREDVWFSVAALFYLFYAVAVLVLAVMPAVRDGSFGQAVLLGAILGFCAYGTYDITNLATVRDWPVTVAIVDMIWGTVLTATVSAVGYLAYSWATGSA